MRLKSIDKETANRVWLAHQTQREFGASSANIETIGQGGDELSDVELEGLVDRLKSVQDKYEDKNMNNVGGQIDSDLTEIVHSELSKFAGVRDLCQIGFWRWLSNIACDGYFWQFIMWRFNSKHLLNWGITSSPGKIIEVYFYRAWLRGHKMHDPDEQDPYKYAKLGSSGVWRFYVLRQELGRDREFVKAFLDTIHDKDGKTLVRETELKEKLIPALRAWTSGATFSHLSYKENIELIQHLLIQQLPDHNTDPIKKILRSIKRRLS